MGKIYYIIGKSASGKDSILDELLKDEELNLKKILQYTTRPKRDNEEEGKEYRFIGEKETEAFLNKGKIIEMRTYHTIFGDWKYMMVQDGSIRIDQENYAAVGTIESYVKVRDYFGAENVIPFYIDVETGERLQRALNREKKNEKPKYTEMCRRFLADEKDFSAEELEKAGLMKNGVMPNRIMNEDFSKCIQEIKKRIQKDKQ